MPNRLPDPKLANEDCPAVGFHNPPSSGFPNNPPSGGWENKPPSGVLENKLLSEGLPNKPDGCSNKPPSKNNYRGGKVRLRRRRKRKEQKEKGGGGKEEEGKRKEERTKKKEKWKQKVGGGGRSRKRKWSSVKKEYEKIPCGVFENKLLSGILAKRLSEGLFVVSLSAGLVEDKLTGCCTKSKDFPTKIFVWFSSGFLDKSSSAGFEKSPAAPAGFGKNPPTASLSKKILKFFF